MSSRPYIGKPEPVDDPALPILVSYHYAREGRGFSKETTSRVLRDPAIEMMLDSGAFSAANAGAEIKLDDYMRYLEENRGWHGYVALDKLGDPRTTAAQLDVMRSNGFSPVPVHVWGDDEAKMNELFEWAPWVCLGGFRRPGRGPAPLSYIKQKMTWAAGRDVHWLGYVTLKVLAGMRPYSADCSSWSAPYRWGKIRFYLGGLRWSQPWDIDRASKERPSLVELKALEACGFSASDFRNPFMWRRNKRRGIGHRRFLTLQLAAFNWVNFVLDWRQRYGTRIFIACRLAEGELEALLRAHQWRKAACKSAL